MKNVTEMRCKTGLERSVKVRPFDMHCSGDFLEVEILYLNEVLFFKVKIIHCFYEITKTIANREC